MTPDAVLFARLRAAIGDVNASNIEPDEQVELTLKLLERARETKEAARA